MVEKSLAEKMKLKAGASACVLNATPGYLEKLRPPQGSHINTALEGAFDWLQVFVQNRAELDQLAPSLATALEPGGLLWLTFPKGSSRNQTDLTRDQGWDAMQGADLKWTNLISVDETWSAFSLRPFRPGEPRQSFR
jgi:hypothetical protein